MHIFPQGTYTRRRKELAQKMGNSGLVLLLGNSQSPRTYKANIYPFRQDGNFLYYFGLAEPGLIGLMDLDSGEETIFGHEATMDDVVWTGPVPSLKELAESVGVRKTRPRGDIAAVLAEAHGKGRKIHFPPPYRGEAKIELHHWLGVPAGAAEDHASKELIRAIVSMREHKSPEEIEEIEQAVNLTGRMHKSIMHGARANMTEAEAASLLWHEVRSMDSDMSFLPIVSIHGEVLHNEHYRNELESGRLLLVDCGGESPLGYAGDMTRTFPVGPKFSPDQKAVYEVCLHAQENAILALKPGVPYRDIHKLAARTIVEGLSELGVMQGDAQEAVEAGAHALFFPHGLGHMMGLEVHDMEGLGEDNVGYNSEFQRSEQFGLAFLRMGRPLEEGHVVTVEPGIYFIPELIRQWKKEGMHKDFIQYSKLEDYLDFGGIRIEDDYLITEDSARLLGSPVPKTVEEIEEIRKGA